MNHHLLDALNVILSFALIVDVAVHVLRWRASRAEPLMGPIAKAPPSPRCESCESRQRELDELRDAVPRAYAAGLPANHDAAVSGPAPDAPAGAGPSGQAVQGAGR